jgi:signal transduction histidine kinase
MVGAMEETSAAIIFSASLTGSIALVGIIVTVAVGACQQRKTLEHTATQARLSREADVQREARERAQRRYERLRGIVEPYVSLAREMGETSGSWQIVMAPATLDQIVAKILERINEVWVVAEQRRGDFEVEPGLDDLRATFKRMASAYQVFAYILRDRTLPGWSSLAGQKTQEVLIECDAFIETARALVAELAAEGTDA